MKNKIVSVFFLLFSVLAVPAIADDSKAVATKEMEVLGSKILTEALNLLQTSGAIYPFALLMGKDQGVSLVGYSGQEEKKPSPESYAWTLLNVIREKTNESAKIRVAALAKMHVVEVEGQKIPGLWILIDHIDAPALVVFQPLIPGDKPKHFSLGEKIYQPSNDSLFVLK